MYSLRDSIIKPDELVEKLKDLGYVGVAKNRKGVLRCQKGVLMAMDLYEKEMTDDGKDDTLLDTRTMELL